MGNIFCEFGELCDSVQIGVDKFGDPFAKIAFWELNDAIRCYEAAHSLNGLKVGLRTLKVDYSKFVQTQRYNTQRGTIQGRARQTNGFIRPKQNGFNGMIRPKAVSSNKNGMIRPRANISTNNGFIRPNKNGMARPKATSSNKNGIIRP